MSTLKTPHALPAAIAGIVASAGTQELGVETGGFILGDWQTREGTVLAVAGTAGVMRTPLHFSASELALAALFEWTAAAGLHVLAGWHSHRGPAFLSDVDLEGGFNVKEFISAVVPYFHDPSANPDDWGWWTYDGSEWLESPAPVLTSGDYEMITFEEGCVRER